jgi:pimeloyl-ACP methyl ester carboxylesterase
LVEPFEYSVSDAAITDLQVRVRSTRWPDFMDQRSWTYGADEDFFRSVATYWVDSFSWREEERKWKTIPQFLFSDSDTRVHFCYVKGKGPRPLPLLLTHGWPGSFLEFLKIIPLLTDPAAHDADPNDSFDVVVPSLPGFGFSGPTHRPGINTFEIAKIWVKLMKELGYPRFVAQGGDIGASVSTILGWKHPDAVIAFHLNYIPGSYLPYVKDGDPITDEEKLFQAAKEKWAEAKGAYAHIHRTQPELAAIALNDSPMGLAAWIIDKFREWSDCGGDVEQRFSKSELLANVSLYWFTQTIASSMRLYWEGSRAPLRFNENERIAVPCGIARFPGEAPFPPRSWVERVYNVQHWTEMENGGHFAAAEEFELLASDIREFFRPYRVKI